MEHKMDDNTGCVLIVLIVAAAYVLITIFA